MSNSTVFVQNLTTVNASWLNDVNNFVYGGTIPSGGFSAINQLIYNNGTALAGLTTANNGVLITSATGAPSISTTIPLTTQLNITELGTITAGTWRGSVIAGTFGGTGVNNGSSTITIGNNITFSGAFTFTGIVTANTSITFPTSGTLVNSAVTTLSSLVSVGTITTGVWNATPVTVSFGGTGVSSLPAYELIAGGTTTTGAVQSISNGTTGQFLISNGATALPSFQSVPSTVAINIQSFTSSGTYTPTSGMLYCVVRGVGGGGGAGGAASGSGTAMGGGGGGSGGYGEILLTAAQIGASKAITIGAAGNGGSIGAAGGSGSASSVGSLFVVGGGGGGAASAPMGTGMASAGGTGGTVTTALVHIPGMPGGAGWAMNNSSFASVVGGCGGSNPLGYGAPPTPVMTPATALAGAAGTGFGAGGSGAASCNAVSAVGGAGTAGIIIITEYI